MDVPKEEKKQKRQLEFADLKAFITGVTGGDTSKIASFATSYIWNDLWRTSGQTAKSAPDETNEWYKVDAIIENQLFVSLLPNDEVKNHIIPEFKRISKGSKSDYIGIVVSVVDWYELAGVDGVVHVITPQEWADEKVLQVVLPFPDFSADNANDGCYHATLDYLEKLTQDNPDLAVLVHCKAGRSRSTQFAITFRAKVKEQVDEMLRIVSKGRSQSEIHASHRAFIDKTLETRTKESVNYDAAGKAHFLEFLFQQIFQSLEMFNLLRYNARKNNDKWLKSVRGNSQRAMRIQDFLSSMIDELEKINPLEHIMPQLMEQNWFKQLQAFKDGSLLLNDDKDKSALYKFVYANSELGSESDKGVRCNLIKSFAEMVITKFAFYSPDVSNTDLPVLRLSSSSNETSPKAKPAHNGNNDNNSNEGDKKSPRLTK